jgi:hypothetical protein
MHKTTARSGSARVGAIMTAVARPGGHRSIGADQATVEEVL